MKYMGSKNRIAKHLLPIMLAECEKHNITKWVEPFVGGANMIDKVPDTFERIGYALNDHVIHALIDIDIEHAKDAVIKLSVLMRYLLYETSHGRTTLRKELDLIESVVK